MSLVLAAATLGTGSMACDKTSAQPCGNAAADAAIDPKTASPFTIQALKQEGIGSENSTGWPHVGTVSVDIDWKQGPFTSALLVIDLESACFPFEKWTADPPPTGQNWPAHCDAFDRNLNLYLDDSTQRDAGAAPPYEIVHAITPFGGPEHIEVDLTDLANALPGPHKLRVDLGSYSDEAGKITGSNAGWTISARIEVAPGPAPRHVLAAIPLYAGRIQADEPWPVIAWTVPAQATGGRIEYRTSGHGQGPRVARCVGPAEEFCDRWHQILVDGTTVENVEPWREDCGDLCTLAHQGAANAGFDYCQQNPGGAIESVRAPRANWCPGSMTPPYSFTDIPALSVPGPHTFSFQVSQIAPGGNWLVSAIYYAYAP